jgi:hypothetical protein
MWNPSSFYVIDKLLNDTRMNNDYFVTNMLIPLEQAIFLRWRAPHQKQFVVHLDNCSVHISRASTDWLEKYGMRRMSHSLILFAWFDPHWLLLISYIERKARTDSGGWRRSVFEYLQEILKDIDQEELNGVFQAWVQQVQEVSQGNGGYVRWQIIFIYIDYVQFHQTRLDHVLIDQTISWLPVLSHSDCERLTKMFHDKANRINQPSSKPGEWNTYSFN